jgi:hypothetical protein
MNNDSKGLKDFSESNMRYASGKEFEVNKLGEINCAIKKTNRGNDCDN